MSAVRRLREALGAAGLAALALLGASLAFLVLVLQPLEARNGKLLRQLEQAPRRAAGMQTSAPAAQLAAFYDYLDSGQSLPHWLSRLHAIAGGCGLRLAAGDYRARRDGGRIERYEIALPVTGTYAQLREFLRQALAEIPLLSLDQASFSRPRADSLQLQAELRFTLHLLVP